MVGLGEGAVQTLLQTLSLGIAQMVLNGERHKMLYSMVHQHFC